MLLRDSKDSPERTEEEIQYILSDMSSQIMEIEGDEFAENDYGLVVDTLMLLRSSIANWMHLLKQLFRMIN